MHECDRCPFLVGWKRQKGTGGTVPFLQSAHIVKINQADFAELSCVPEPPHPVTRGSSFSFLTYVLRVQPRMQAALGWVTGVLRHSLAYHIMAQLNNIELQSSAKRCIAWSYVS